MRVPGTPAKRKVAALLGATVLLLGIFFALGQGGDPAPESATGATQARPGNRTFEVGIPTLEKVEAFVQGYGARVESTEAELGRLRTEIEETRKQLQESLAGLEKARGEETSLVKSLAQDLKSATGSDGLRIVPVPPGAARVRKFDLPVPPEAEKDSSVKNVHIPAGSFGEITLLTGLLAPVSSTGASGEAPLARALPIHARLDTAAIGPNRTRIPIADAFLVGRAEGDPNGSRALIQFHKLALVKPDGEALEVAINADVADSDGVLGLSGRYVWRVQEILTLSGLAGTASGAAEALAAREVASQLNPFGGATSIVTGDPLKFAGSRGAAKGLERISETVAKRLDEITPAIHVPNGKRATVLFIDGVTLDGFRTSEAKRDENRYPYRGLDFDR